MTYLDRVIDINYYPSPESAASNPRWRPVGLGCMGLQDVFFALGLPFDSEEARELSTRIAEEIYLSALERSAELAAEHGAHPAYADTRAARGDLQPDLWGVTPTQTERWAAARRIAEHGLRNSLLVAIAPTATIASIAAATSASSRRSPTCSSGRPCRGSSSRSTRRWSASCGRAGCGPPRCASRSSGRRARCRGSRRSPRRSGAVPHRLGAAAEGADRDGRRAAALHRPEPVAQPVPAEPDHREAQLDVPLRLEGRAEDDVLPALAARRRASSRRRCPTAATAGSRAVEAVACSLENPETCEACE